jgi:predicted metal-binding membrane protein
VHDMPMGSAWTAWTFTATLGMWTVMMAAMMLPSFVPMLRLVAASNRDFERGDPAVMPVTFVAAGYLGAWTMFSVLATAIQLALRSATALSPGMALVDQRLSAVALICAGIYQLTPLKAAYLAQCRSPFALLLHASGGTKNALQMGLDHGVYCVACCWSLMVVLFVVGVMNIPWAVGLAAAVAVEKLVGGEQWPRRLIGVSLLAWGCATAAGVLH